MKTGCLFPYHRPLVVQQSAGDSTFIHFPDREAQQAILSTTGHRGQQSQDTRLRSRHSACSCLGSSFPHGTLWANALHAHSSDKATAQGKRWESYQIFWALDPVGLSHVRRRFICHHRPFQGCLRPSCPGTDVTQRGALPSTQLPALSHPGSSLSRLPCQPVHVFQRSHCENAQASAKKGHLEKQELDQLLWQDPTDLPLQAWGINPLRGVGGDTGNKKAWADLVCGTTISLPE